MNFTKPETRMPLPSSIKETMMNSHSDASIINMRRIRPNQHRLIMLPKVTSVNKKQAPVTTLTQRDHKHITETKRGRSAQLS